jgi:TP901-1 family phage major tail protein
MATTGVLNGTDVKFYVYDSESPAGYKAVAYAQSASVNMAMETRDITSKDSDGQRELAEGKKSWNMSSDILLAWDATYGFSELQSAWENRTKIQVRFTTGVAGDVCLTGYGYITSLSATGGVEDNAASSISVEGSGSLAASVFVS